MADELMHVAPPVLNPPMQIVMEPAEQLPLPPGAVGSQTPEQVNAAEAAFRHEQHEHSAVSGLIGMWAGTLLLHDLAKEHFDEDEEEEDEQPHLEDRSHP
jgi:hypothetical protein